MAAAIILEFEGVDKSMYEAVNSKLGIDPSTGKGDWPAGMQSHLAGTTDDGGLVVVEVWDSREKQGAFMNSRLGAAIADSGVPAPVRITWIDVLAQHTL
jgi:hypothetical protein